jgi:hypothetical protein
VSNIERVEAIMFACSNRQEAVAMIRQECASGNRGREVAHVDAARARDWVALMDDMIVQSRRPVEY